MEVRPWVPISRIGPTPPLHIISNDRTTITSPVICIQMYLLLRSPCGPDLGDLSPSCLDSLEVQAYLRGVVAVVVQQHSLQVLEVLHVLQCVYAAGFEHLVH